VRERERENTCENEKYTREWRIGKKKRNEKEYKRGDNITEKREDGRNVGMIKRE
jgi:hypothetical protein